MARQVHRRVLSLQRLEDRTTPAVQAFFVGGVLAVVGDANANDIEVSADANGNLQVTENGVSVEIRSVPGTAVLSQTRLVVVTGRGENDDITIDASMASKTATLDGGEGDDTLLCQHMGNSIQYGGNGHDTMRGGLGSDFLIGGAGDDSLDGGGLDGKRDALLGGTGADTFFRYVGEFDFIFDFNENEGDEIIIVP